MASDDFGLGDLFSNVNRAVDTSTPVRLAPVVQPQEDVVANSPFTLDLRLYSETGVELPPPPGCTAETELRMEDISNSGRLGGTLPRFRGNALTTADLCITSVGQYSIEIAVTLPDRKTTLRRSISVTARAAKAAAPSPPSGSVSPAPVPPAEDSGSESESFHGEGDGAAEGAAGTPEGQKAGAKKRRKEKRKRSESGSEASGSESLSISGSESMSLSSGGASGGAGGKRKRRGSSGKSSSHSHRDGSASDEGQDSADDVPSPLLAPNAPVTTYECRHGGGDGYDKHGVLYHLALNKMKQRQSSRWVNPMARGLVEVTASSVRKGDLSNLVERRPIDKLCLCTEDEAGSWLEVDLKDHVCAPNSYTLGNRVDKSRDVLKTWTLEGSVNRKLWVVISPHVNDLQLSEARLQTNTFTFKIPQCKYYFRYFRIRIGEEGSTSAANILACTCFELYGFFRKRKEGEGESSLGVPSPVEAPVLQKLGLRVRHVEKANTDFKDLMKSRFALKERKRKPKPSDGSAQPEKGAAKPAAEKPEKGAEKGRTSSRSPASKRKRA